MEHLMNSGPRQLGLDTCQHLFYSLNFLSFTVYVFSYFVFIVIYCRLLNFELKLWTIIHSNIIFNFHPVNF